MEEENVEFQKLSIEDRCSHKLWKARLSGYEDAAKLFHQLDDDKSSEWTKYIGLLKKFVADAHVSAQEKGLEAVLAFIENYGPAGRTAPEVMAALVQKCIGSPRTKTKELAQQVALMYIEIEKHDIVIEELLKGSEVKNPKVAHGCLVILHQALKEFGAKVINIGKIVKKMPAILSDRDKNIREQGKVLVVEIYRWIGPALKPQLSSLKPVQITELEAEFEKVPSGLPAPTRLLKSQQAKKVAAATGDYSGDAPAGVDGADEQEIDPTEFLEPVDILSKLPKDFFTQIEAKKWTERKDVLEILEKELAAAPRLEAGDYGDLVRALKKVVAKDSNVIVIAVALKCLTGLASGLKKKFSPYVGLVFPTVLEKFKEKKQNVVQASRDLVDVIFPTASLEQLSEDLITALENKNPGVKMETALFLSRCFSRCTPTILNKKLLKIYITALLKKLNESELSVRDAAAQAIGTAMKVVGEKAIGPFLGDPGENKMSKIKSFCEKAELQKPIVTSSSKSTPSEGEAPKSQSSKAIRGGVKSKGVKREATVVKQPQSVGDTNASIDISLSSVLPIEISNRLMSNDDSVRTNAYQQLLEFLKNSPNVPILPLLLCGNGLNDNVTKVIVLKLQCIKFIAENNPNFTLSTPDLNSVVMSLLKKLTNAEYASIVSSCLSSIAKSVDSDEVALIVLSPTVKAEPELWAQALKWICEGIMYHSLSFSESFLQEEAQKAIDSDHFSVRNSGLAMIGSFQLMPKKEAIKKVIPKKKEVPKPPAEADPPTGSLNLSAAVNSALITELTDDAWKVRHDGLAKVQALVDAASSVHPDLGELQPVIEELLVDKNSKVVVSCLALLTSFAKTMGPSCKQYTRSFAPKVLKSLNDPKVWVRSAVIQTLNTWGSVAGYKEFFDNDNLADAIKGLALPSARLELYNWFNAVLPGAQTLPKDGLVACLPHLYQSIEDRSPDVRRAAGDALTGFMIHLGFDTMMTVVESTRGGQNIRTLLEKNRGCVPEPIDIPPKSSGPLNKQKLAPGSSATYTKPQKKMSVHPSRVGGLGRNKKEEDAFDNSSPCLEANNLKPQRSVDEQKLKSLKWNFSAPRPEFIEQLRDQMVSANVNESIITFMFHADFRNHIKAIDLLSEDLLTNRRGLVANLDLILKWMTLRFFDTNPSVLLRGLEYLNTVFQCLIEDGYTMLDFEASSFIPYLLLKAGDPKDTVRNHVRNIFRAISSLHPRIKMFNYLMDGLKSKNARQRAEMLEHLSWLLENYSLATCCPNPIVPLKEVARYIGDRDVAVRNAALNCMVAVYFQEGEKLYKYVGQISHKDMTLLEERIKRACKNRPVASVKPLPTEASSSPKHQVMVPTIEPDDSTEVIEDSHLSSHSKNPASPNVQTNLRSPNHSSPERRDLPCSNSTITIFSPQQVNGPFRLDLNSDDEETESGQFQQPEIEDIDLNFLKELPKSVPMTSMSPSGIPLSAPHPSNSVAAIKWEINQIANPDLEKAISAMSSIESFLCSGPSNAIKPFLDFMVHQLIQQLIYLNQSHHPDVANCYRGNFTLVMKLSDNKPLCQEISEVNVQKLIKQILLLITERRHESTEQDMFIRVANNVVIRILESANKTHLMCALIKLLAETLHPPSNKHFQELVTKCMWKLHRTHAVWDCELNYERLLTEINFFLQDFPTSWWKTQESDVPIRTIKTIIHSMVKQRGTAVKDSLKLVTSVGPDSELSSYVRKLIKHLRSDESVGDTTKEQYQQNQNVVDNSELSKLFNVISETPEPCDNASSIRRLQEYRISHPEVDLEPYILRLPPTKQNIVRRFLAMVDQKLVTSLRVNQAHHIGSNNDAETKKECELMWKRLNQIRERTGYQSPSTNNITDKKTVL